MRPPGCLIIMETKVTVALRRVEGEGRPDKIFLFAAWQGEGCRLRMVHYLAGRGTMGEECGCLCVIVLILTQAGGGLGWLWLVSDTLSPSCRMLLFWKCSFLTLLCLSTAPGCHRQTDSKLVMINKTNCPK